VSSSGGAPITLVDSISNASFGMAWLDDGTIVYATGAGTGAMPYLAQVSANGGKSVTLSKSDSLGDALPTAIHGAHALLFSRCRSLSDCDLWAVDTRSRQAHLVLRGVTWARYATSGQIVFVQENRLAAIAFDVGSLSVRGLPTALDRNAIGTDPLELSPSGTMVLRESGDTTAAPFDMVWVDRSGRITPVDTSWHFDVTRFANDASLSLSPDGTHVAIGLFAGGNDDIWVKQLPNGPVSRLTFDPAAEMRPRWTPDGREVTFLSQRRSGGVYEHRVDGTGRDSLLLAGNIEEAVLSPHADWLVTRAGSLGLGRGGRDIRGMRVGRDGTLTNLIVTPFDEEAVALSPDGRWLAYTSDETGKSDVFIRSFPNTDSVKRQVSNGGGLAPLWSRDGRELFFVNDNNEMMAVSIAAGSPITVGDPRALFHLPDELLAVEYEYYTPWDVAADGRFLMARLRRERSAAASTVVVAENWLTELKAKIRK
jgi:eukaryotic-like serine/threonine-protein kinase